MNFEKSILVTGGAGYIGSHVSAVLLERNFRVVVVDSLTGSHKSSVDHLKRIGADRLIFCKETVHNTSKIADILIRYRVEVVIHLAAFKVISESIERPLDYYENNVVGSISLLRAMSIAGVDRIVFSSTAAVYGAPRYFPIDESHCKSPLNPYASSKLLIEDVLADICSASSSFGAICLRYFNPVGAHPSGLIGETLSPKSSNLMPHLVGAALSSPPIFKVFGTDFDTPDGTGVRDFIHVMDLADGHAAAIDFVLANQGWHEFNLGVGRGLSVFELKSIFERVSGIELVIEQAPRRAGDVECCFAKVDKAIDQLDWKASRSMEDACESAWNFYKKSVG